MTVDPLRDQLAANCDASPESAEYGEAQRALQDYDEAKARGRYLVGEQTAREDIGNALQVLEGWRYPADAISGDFRRLTALLRHALTQLESPK